MDTDHHALLLRVYAPRAYILATPDEDIEQRTICLERFGIDDVRELTKIAYGRPLECAIQRVVVCTDFITHEAQNALLKVLEEPPLTTRFLFIIPPDFILLATLASRFQVADVPVTASEDVKEFQIFKTHAYADRIALVETKTKQGDAVWQQAIKQGLTAFIVSAADNKNLATYEYIARLLLTRGASNKMLLEQLALTLPTS